MSNQWTAERRARQSELIKAWRPWEHSTGPVTAVGKERVARNAWQGGTRPLLRHIARAIREQRERIENYGINAVDGGR